MPTKSAKTLWLRAHRVHPTTLGPYTTNANKQRVRDFGANAIVVSRDGREYRVTHAGFERLR